MMMLYVGLMMVSVVLGNGAKETDDRLGLERPSTETAPMISESGLDALLAEVYGNGNTGDNTGTNPGNSPGNNEGVYNPGNSPGNNEGVYNPGNSPGNNEGVYSPGNNEGVYNPGNSPGNNEGVYNPGNSPGNNEGVYNPGNSPNNEGVYNPDTNGGGCECVQWFLCHDNNTINEDGVGVIDIRIKDGDCNYLEKCCGGENIHKDKPVFPTPIPQPEKDLRCGVRNPEGLGFRITGNNDNEAQYSEFPWMVAVVKQDQSHKERNVYQCGGSLIHPQVVLTGAHCVKGKSGLVIRAGEWDTNTQDEQYPTQDVNVQDVIVHEKFNEGTLANDPALLILQKPVDMSLANVGLICLPDPNEIMDGRDCVASGWGKDLYGKEGKYQVILKRVDVPIVERRPCLEALHKTRLGPHFKLHDSFICAGGIPGRDTCKGDGGSPLVCPSKTNRDIYVQAGIVAWGIDCGTATPGVYVNVPYFVNWIQEKLQSHGISIGH